ncbi:DUF3991 and TOPRIM domain-containing protein [Kozakia baliensis]|uniref:DUF3991 and TOPRIM domain-containing protein n=1 Tax=Kozakia baliensis TaxID=153496 RepID=UPI00087A384C|nr:DUF3991 and TOPRIM domain-containing protein [Kozakia baliensis]AOX21615.1 hypothetical protein A0U90_14010 [Kozakia baliensis]
MAYRSSPEAQREELQEFRDSVNCSTVLEKEGFRLDRAATAQRSARNLKFRRGEGEIVIVNHEGKGWWSPSDSTSKGDVIKLMQFLHPDMNLGHVRRELRDMIGMQPTYEVRERTKETPRPEVQRDPSWMWSHRAAPQPGSEAWRYLTETRKLTPEILDLANRQNLLREGPKGTAWFAHHDDGGNVTGMEMRGPDYRGFSSGGGGKRLFRMEADPGQPVSRVVVAEAAITALSFAALDRFRSNSLYLSTAGGMSPESLAEMKQLLARVAQHPEARLIIAVDNDHQGDRNAEKFKALADEAGLWSGRLSPKAAGQDWNDVLRARGEKVPAPTRPFSVVADTTATPAALQAHDGTAGWIDRMEARRLVPRAGGAPTVPRQNETGPTRNATPGM